MELWNRYTNNKGTPSANKSVAFAHLINESSPRSSATAGSVSGLRRWASCGVEFPASTKKKRRIHAVLGADKGRTEDVFNAPSSDGVFQGQQPAETSKLAGMLQRMRESISKPQSRISSQIPSSSSPLPEPERHIPPAESPLQRRGRDEDQHAETSETVGGAFGGANEDEAMDEARRSSGSSDEFGDADFDSEMVDALEISNKPPEPVENRVSVPTEPVDPGPDPSPRVSMPAPVPANDADSDDEFGLDDEDIFAADLEKVASLYDNRPEESPQDNEAAADAVAGDALATNTAPAPPVINLVDDDSDDFGDDIDTDVFAAAEVAATQAPATTVRRPHTEL